MLKPSKVVVCFFKKNKKLLNSSSAIGSSFSLWFMNCISTAHFHNTAHAHDKQILSNDAVCNRLHI